MTSLIFAENMFGKLKPEIIDRIQACIDNPTQETWDECFTIIINPRGRMKTLWKAVIASYPDFPRRKPHDSPWPVIPTSEMIINSINNELLKYNNN